MTKSKATIARDKRGRKTRAEEIESGNMVTMTIRVPADAIPRLDSDAKLEGVTRSELARNRVLHRPPDADRVVESTQRLYYGMRETGAELLESNKTTRMAYEENARAAFALSSAVRRVGVNVNQIAKKVNTSGFEDGEIWLAELQNCVQLLNEIL